MTHYKTLPPPREYIFAGILALLFSATVTYFFIPDIEKARRAPSWMHTQGEVTSLVSRERPFGPGGGATTSSTRLTYRYVVDGTTHEGHCVYITPCSQHVTDSEYPVGKQVTVYYDPEEPQMAALYPRQLPYQIWSYIGLMAFFVLGGLYAFWCANVSYKAGRRREEEDGFGEES